ncbi:hypothetical protein F2P56_001717, partial [Juglans regia]
MKPKLGFLVLVLVAIFCSIAESRCSRECNLALASYYVWPDSNLTTTILAQLFQSTLSIDPETIVSYNKEKIPNKDTFQQNIRVNIPFPCTCIDGEFLGYTFDYTVQSGDTYDTLARQRYANLTTTELLRRYNSYNDNNIPDTNAKLNVTVKCSCGDSSVSKDFGLFVTYPLRPNDTLESVAEGAGLNSSYTTLLQNYNPGVNFSQGSGVVYIPGKDQNDSYRPMPSSSTGLAVGVIAGIAIGGVAGVVLFAACIYLGCYRKKKVVEAMLPLAASEYLSSQNGHGIYAFFIISSPPLLVCSYRCMSMNEYHTSHALVHFSPKHIWISKFVIFFFSLPYNTYHLYKSWQVRLIGYCVERSLFVVYEYIENGNLSQHLRGSSGMDPLPWSTRVQIALDSARGLEYIHEHTVPVYIHRDIKSANILIDKNFHGKVADFGLTKLTEVGSSSLPTRLVGTFGYMPPEYAQYGDVSPKVDVYAFGVVLYELISAKEAVVKPNGSDVESKGLVALVNILSILLIPFL